MVLANVGDSRAVLATISDDGSLVPVQLTTDFKPNLPRKLPSISNDHYLKTCFIESKILSYFSLFFFFFRSLRGGGAYNSMQGPGFFLE